MLVNSVLRKKAAAFVYGAAKRPQTEEAAEEAPVAEEAAEAPKTEEDFNAMTVKDLKAYAQENGIAIESKAKKAEIIEAILAAKA